MKCSREFLVGIVEKASYFHERLDGARFVPRPEKPNEADAVSQRMAHWLRNAAPGDAEQFEKRVQWDGLTPDRAKALATGVRLANPDEPLPSWTATLEAALAGYSELDQQNPRKYATELRFLESGEPYAFEHLMLPFVLHASRRVRENSPEIDALLTEGAQAVLERYLLQWLCAVSAETIELEFTVHRAVRQNGSVLGAMWSLPGQEASTTMYDAFVSHIWREGALKFFEEYAALGRLMACITDLWVTFVVEFLTRLQQDASDLRTALEAWGPVVTIAPGLSDRHKGGTTSLRVKFESGAECIYKPKSLDSEKTYYDLLTWCNQHDAPLPFHIFSGVYRPSHGWVELVENKPCQTEEEVDRYYRRAGMLLCLVYALEGSDCHHENIIASGEFPVLIDLETILQPRVAMIEGSGEEDASSMANRVFYWDSVFRTALLPRWEFGQNGESYDVSGLGGVEGQKTSFYKKAWQYINTDAMKLKRQALHTRPHMNLVWLNGKQCMPADYVDQMVDGFERMYQFLTARQDAMFAPAGPFAAMAALPLRFIYRHTKIYTAVLNTYLLPQYLRDGMDTSIQVDVLCRPLLHAKSRHPFWPMLVAETASLLQADIPLFGASADSTALDIGNNEIIPGFFGEPSFELLKLRFSKLSTADRDLQVSYIRSCFDSGPGVTAVPSVEPPAQTSVDRGELIAEALAIAADIRKAAITSQDRSATWVTLAYYAEAQRWQLQPMTARLYDGVTGTALFLAAMHRVDPTAGFRELALAGFKTAAQYLDDAPSIRALFEAGIGAGLGASSLVYAFARGGVMLGEQSLLDDAMQAARLLTPERIAEDRRFDLLGGTAGALLGLLTLHSLYAGSDRNWLIDRAAAGGRHLLEHRTQSPEGPRAWRTLGGELLAGFSHGAAGIAYALTRLHRATGAPEFADAAAEACAYEAALFSKEKGNWPDLRFPVTKLGHAFQTTWCHGATGIGLGRAGSVNGSVSDAALAEIEQAMETTIQAGTDPLDHLCCGNLGRAEALLVAGRKLGREDWQNDARRLTGTVLARARRGGRYGLGWGAGPYIPSFHQGMAGIGYQLLRLADPGRFPSILMWE